MSEDIYKLAGEKLKEEMTKTPPVINSVSKNVQSDVVELLKQVLKWTPLYRPGLNKALLQAAKVGSLGCVKMLVASGAEIDAEDDIGDTPFVHAFRGRHVAVMNYLHQCGCNTEIAKIGLALSTKDSTFVDECVRMGVPVENEDWDVGLEEEMDLLLTHLHMDPFEGQYCRENFQDSPFMWAVQEGRKEVVRWMVQKHPCIHKYTHIQKSQFYDSALFRAIKNKRRDNLKLLLEELGASLECRDAQDRTPLLVACAHDEQTALYLLDRGTDMHTHDGEGLTALHWAACSGQVETCRRLLHGGVDVDRTANLGATPLMVACSSRRVEIVNLLLGLTGPKEAQNVSVSKQLEDTQYRRTPQAEVNTATPEGWTALHVAVRACVPSSILHSLVLRGAKTDVCSSRLSHNSDLVPASTPLLIAVALNSLRMMHILINAFCDVNLAAMVSLNNNNNTDGCEGLTEALMTPLQLSLHAKSFHATVVLIKLGCKADATCMTMLQSASSPANMPPHKLQKLQMLIKKTASQPASLKHLSRMCVRECLSRGRGWGGEKGGEGGDEGGVGELGDDEGDDKNGKVTEGSCEGGDRKSVSSLDESCIMEKVAGENIDNDGNASENKEQNNGCIDKVRHGREHVMTALIPHLPPLPQSITNLLLLNDIFQQPLYSFDV